MQSRNHRYLSDVLLRITAAIGISSSLYIIELLQLQGSLWSQIVTIRIWINGKFNNNHEINAVIGIFSNSYSHGANATIRIESLVSLAAMRLMQPQRSLEVLLSRDYYNHGDLSAIAMSSQSNNYMITVIVEISQPL